MVTVEKAADVIPKVSGVVTTTHRREVSKEEAEKEKEKEKGEEVPGAPLCPCDRRVPLVREGIDLHCRAPACPEVAIARIVHFASKEAMNIEGLGEGLVRDLFRQGLVRSAVDIYSLLDEDGPAVTGASDLQKKKKAQKKKGKRKEEETEEGGGSKREALSDRKGWGEKKIANLLRSVERSKQSRDLASFLFALGIPHLGKHTAQLLAVRLLPTQDLSCPVLVGPSLPDCRLVVWGI
jgi:DNA ligase (NAD+)